MLYNPSTENFKCSYMPCQHKGVITFATQHIANLNTRHCPKCNLFTYQWQPIDIYTNELSEAIKDFVEGMNKEIKPPAKPEEPGER